MQNEVSRWQKVPWSSNNPPPPQYWTSHQAQWEKGSIGRFSLTFFNSLNLKPRDLGAGFTLGELVVFPKKLMHP